MAANPSSLADSRTLRAGTGIGIAIAIAATVGAIAFLAPRLREEMREDIFSGAANAHVVLPAAVVAPAADTIVPPPAQPLALKPAMQIVPPESLGPGEAEVPAAPVPAVRESRSAPHRQRAHAPPRKKPTEPIRSAQAPAPRLIVDDTVGGLPLRAAVPPRRAPDARRDGRSAGRLVGGIHREDPFDYRTWREHRNPDAPSNSPLDRQPG